MKKRFVAPLGLIFILSISITGCSSSSDNNSNAENSSSSSYQAESQLGVESENIPTSDATELLVQFGDEGEAFVMHLEDNSTASAIAGYVGTSQWRLPVYSYDESDVYEYYDVPSRYEIPDNSQTVTQAYAGDVFYSDPNRIVLYYHDAEINEEYTLIGKFDANDEFVSAVENNPVLEGWGNQIVVISDGE